MPNHPRRANKKITVLNLGDGNFVINHGYYGKYAALFIEPAPAPGKPGEDASASGLSKTEVRDGGTVIVLKTLAACDALADELRLAMARVGTK